MRPREKEEMAPLGVRVTASLKHRIDKIVKNSQDTTLQDAVSEALEDFLGKCSGLGSIGLISPKDRATVEEWAAALLRRDRMAQVALSLMEVSYDEWRAANQSAAIARDSQVD